MQATDSLELLLRHVRSGHELVHEVGQRHLCELLVHDAVQYLDVLWILDACSPSALAKTRMVRGMETVLVEERGVPRWLWAGVPEVSRMDESAFGIERMVALKPEDGYVSHGSKFMVMALPLVFICFVR